VVHHYAPQTPAVRASAPIATQIDESRSVTLWGNVHPLAQPAADQGAIGADTPLAGMVLALAPSPGQQAELEALLEAQQDSASPLYHRWLTPEEFGARFGASADAVAKVSAWLGFHGFTIDEVPASRRTIVFSGTAGQVEDAFHTEMHRYVVDGALHMANAQDPQIPAALAGVVTGVLSLHDFRRTSAIATRTPLAAPVNSPSAQPMYSAGSTHYLFPADFATIYDLSPLYAEGVTGSGVSIAIAGRSNIKLSDVAAFRSVAGLAAKAPTVLTPGADPGLKGDDQDEATLDVEWAGAAAPSASVTLVAEPSTATTDGIDLAAAYIVNHALASIVSVSYASCERSMGATELAFYNSLWQQAAAQGMSVFVASGDSGAAGCQAASSAKGSAAGVNGMCSSPYATCVGGTELNEGSGAASYWAAANTASYGSATGYIPEVVWNESGLNGGTGLWATGGGASTVYAQPAWQAAASGAGAANGMRAVPDVSLAAAAHDGSMIYENGSTFIVSGTSVATPSMAGILALAAQKAGRGQGSANPRLYALAEEGGGIFHPTPSGSNAVPGVSGYIASGATYNLATGLGSVDAAALVNNWLAAPPTPPTLSVAVAPDSVALTAGGAAVVAVTVTTGGSFAGPVAFSLSGARAGVAGKWSTTTFTPTPSASSTTISLTFTATARAEQGASTYIVTATGDGLTATRAFTVKIASAQGCSTLLRTVRSICGQTPPVGIHFETEQF
jgi:subtilase family serine protease